MRCAAAALAALALAGCASGDDDEPKTRVALRGSPTEVTIGRPTTLTGTVWPAAPRVELLASTAPAYAQARRVGSARADERGRFSFRVRPRINTSYTVRAADGESNHVVVYAKPRYRFEVEPVGGGRSRFTFVVRHPPELDPTRGPVHFYTGAGNAYKHAGTAALEPRTASLAMATATLPAKPGAAVFACVARAIAPGYGAPPVKGCGDPELRVMR
jgi:hypothetical protein